MVFHVNLLIYVMWDNAGSLCFVTNSKAKEQNLKGKKVDLSIIKIGAQDEKINTMKYILLLVVAQGRCFRTASAAT